MNRQVRLAQLIGQMYADGKYNPMSEESMHEVVSEIEECGGRSGHPADELIQLKSRKDLAYIDGEFFANDGYEDEEV